MHRAALVAASGTIALFAAPVAADTARWVGEGRSIVYSARDEESEPLLSIACANGTMTLDMPDVTLHAGAASRGEIVMSIRTGARTQDFGVRADVEYSDYLEGYTPRLVFRASAAWFRHFLGGDVMDVAADGRLLLKGVSLQGTSRLASRHLRPCL